jgi:hypothetical protein
MRRVLADIAKNSINVDAIGYDTTKKAMTGNNGEYILFHLVSMLMIRKRPMNIDNREISNLPNHLNKNSVL